MIIMTFKTINAAEFMNNFQNSRIIYLRCMSNVLIIVIMRLLISLDDNIYSFLTHQTLILKN